MLRPFYFVLAALAFLAGCTPPSHAQVFIVANCGTVPTSQATLTAGNPGMLFIDNTGKLCTAASVSASITGFTPATTGTPIAVTTGGVTGTLPVGAVVAAFNTGATNTAFCKLGASATTSDIAIPPASWFAFTVGGATQLTCITSTSTTTVNMVGGSGLPTGAGGGGGGGSGGVVTPGTTTSTGTAWSSATGGGTTQAIMSSGGWPAILVQLNQTTTITGGAVTFQGTYDGTNWVTIPVAQILNPNTLANLTNPYTLVASTNQPFLILTQGYQQVRLNLSTVIAGTGAVTPQITLLPYNPTVSALLNPLVAGSAIIGQVGINQTTPGTTNKVVADAIVTPSANFVRPANATPYASGNLVANSTTAGSVVPLSWTATPYSGGNFYVRRFRMTLSGKSVTNTSFRLHLFTVTPATITNGDGGALSVTSANEFCQMDVTIAQVGADVSIGYGVPASGQGNECNGVAAATTIFGLLEARAAYTPTSGETITVIPEIHQN